VTEDARWQRWAARAARRVEQRVDVAKTRVFGSPAARQVIPYRGFGTATEVFLSGRVLANRVGGSVDAADAWWRNVAYMLRHLETDEVPGARVRFDLLHGTGTASTHEAVTDDEGYYRTWLRAPQPLTFGHPWHELRVRVLDPIHPEVQNVEATARVLVPPPTAEFGVISDLDDTVIRTEATRLLQMLKRTLLENARTRLPFPGVAAFYTALQHGASGSASNPIFYVSSSPWNLYGMLTEFMEHQQIPEGPVVLRDWGLSAHGALPTRHGAHKLGAIRQIFDCYPRMSFILIGDSGQEDPEIYRDVVHEYPQRVSAVYIRNVTAAEARTQAIRELSEEVKQAGSELLLSDDTLAGAMHAAARGWMSQDAVRRVAEEVSSSATRPG
jgi:phosphatidate phosphatase APP1